MPDFNYRVTLNALNLEIYGIDQNKVDVGGIGGDASGRVQVIGWEVDSHGSSRLPVAPNDSQRLPTAPPYDLKYTLLLASNDSH